jgi:hypothetical protein
VCRKPAALRLCDRGLLGCFTAAAQLHHRSIDQDSNLPRPKQPDERDRTMRTRSLSLVLQRSLQDCEGHLASKFCVRTEFREVWRLSGPHGANTRAAEQFNWNGINNYQISPRTCGGHFSQPLRPLATTRRMSLRRAWTFRRQRTPPRRFPEGIKRLDSSHERHPKPRAREEMNNYFAIVEEWILDWEQPTFSNEL